MYVRRVSRLQRKSITKCPENYSSAINLICGGGIEAACSFYITDSTKQSLKIKFMPTNIHLPNSHLIGTGFMKYTDNGKLV